jgi:hypothetical protein
MNMLHRPGEERVSGSSSTPEQHVGIFPSQCLCSSFVSKGEHFAYIWILAVFDGEHVFQVEVLLRAKERRSIGRPTHQRVKFHQIILDWGSYQN